MCRRPSGESNSNGCLNWWRGAARLRQRYTELLGNLEGLILPFEPEWARSNWQSYCVRLPDRVDQKAVMQNLLDQGIATRRGIMCAHREAPYLADKPRHDLRQSELAQDHSILLPIYAQMREDDQVARCGCCCRTVLRH